MKKQKVQQLLKADNQNQFQQLIFLTNYEDIAKTTIKQTTLYSNQNGNIKSAFNKPIVFNPNKCQ